MYNWEPRDPTDTTRTLSFITPTPHRQKTFRTRMHSSRVRTARLLTVSRRSQGGLSSPPGGRTPPAYPWRQTTPPPPDADCPTLDEDPPGHVTCDACWEVTPHPHPRTVDRMTDRSFWKHYLPASGNNYVVQQTVFVLTMLTRVKDEATPRVIPENRVVCAACKASTGY